MSSEIAVLHQSTLTNSLHAASNKKRTLISENGGEWHKRRIMPLSIFDAVSLQMRSTCYTLMTLTSSRRYKSHSISRVDLLTSAIDRPSLEAQNYSSARKHSFKCARRYLLRSNSSKMNWPLVQLLWSEYESRQHLLSTRRTRSLSPSHLLPILRLPPAIPLKQTRRKEKSI